MLKYFILILSLFVNSFIVSYFKGRIGPPAAARVHAVSVEYICIEWVE